MPASPEWAADLCVPAVGARPADASFGLRAVLDARLWRAGFRLGSSSPDMSAAGGREGSRGSTQLSFDDEGEQGHEPPERCPLKSPQLPPHRYSPHVVSPDTTPGPGSSTRSVGYAVARPEAHLPPRCLPRTTSTPKPRTSAAAAAPIVVGTHPARSGLAV